MTIKKISSNHLKEISKLKQKKYRQENNSFLIESEKLVIEALNSNWNIKEIYITNKNFQLIDKIKNKLGSKKINCFELNEKEFSKISNEVSPSGVAALVEKKKYELKNIFRTIPAIIPVFENISDPGNLGTIIRSADWFGFDCIVISKTSVEITNPKVVRASMGSIFHINIFDEVDIKFFLNKAKQIGYKIFGTTLNGKNIAKFEYKERTILIFGNESKGISDEIKKICDDFVSIPSFGFAESLNLAISASIIFYELKRNELLNNLKPKID